MRRIETNHGGYTINEYEVEISQEMRNKALAFASKIKLDDNQYDRLIPREYQIEPGDDQQTIRNKARLILKYTIQRTYVGKLGELAFLVLLNEKRLACNTDGMFRIFEGQENVDNFDFITASNDFNLAGLFENVSEATGDWIPNPETYERIQGIVFDTRYLLKNYDGNHDSILDELVSEIEKPFIEEKQAAAQKAANDHQNEMDA